MNIIDSLKVNKYFMSIKIRYINVVIISVDDTYIPFFLFFFTCFSFYFITINQNI